MPPHWPYFCATPAPPAGCVGVVVGALVVVGPAGADDAPVAESFELMNVSAAWPYSVPYPWCVFASSPLQQYGSAASQ